jgi:hypothetical protein
MRFPRCPMKSTNNKSRDQAQGAGSPGPAAGGLGFRAVEVAASASRFESPPRFLRNSRTLPSNSHDNLWPRNSVSQSRCSSRTNSKAHRGVVRDSIVLRSTIQSSNSGGPRIWVNIRSFNNLGGPSAVCAWDISGTGADEGSAFRGAYTGPRQTFPQRVFRAKQAPC